MSIPSESWFGCCVWPWRPVLAPRSGRPAGRGSGAVRADPWPAANPRCAGPTEGRMRVRRATSPRREAVPMGGLPAAARPPGSDHPQRTTTTTWAGRTAQEAPAARGWRAARGPSEPVRRGDAARGPRGRGPPRPGSRRTRRAPGGPHGELPRERAGKSGRGPGLRAAEGPRGTVGRSIRAGSEVEDGPSRGGPRIRRASRGIAMGCGRTKVACEGATAESAGERPDAVSERDLRAARPAREPSRWRGGPE